MSITDRALAFATAAHASIDQRRKFTNEPYIVHPHEFGFAIADLVEQLTDVSVPEDGNRAIRKEIDRQHSARATAEDQTIKLADLIDNSRTTWSSRSNP